MLVCLLVTTFIFTFSGCARKKAESYEEIRPVRSIVIGRTNGTVGATYSGEIRARFESKLGFRISGKVISRLVEVGMHVNREQPLLKLDPEEASLDSISSKAQVETARNRLTQSQTDLQRIERLYDKKFVSGSELDQQRLMVKEAESQLRSAEAQLKITENRREYTTLSADRSGVVTAINVEAGQVVSAGQSVITVAADGEREVAVSIPESRVDELRKAKNLTVTLWANPGKSYDAALRELAPDTDDITRTYSARVTVRKSDAG
ncbi:MAG: efflux RND transporter periplasmic adaptor subunit, partial [Nitrospirae bacterium]|nr:efflux RND transporter periplasmic adaptor subunit [Nitrospirota bacterium]